MDAFVRLKDTLVQIGILFPRLLLALAILAAGYLVARLLERIVDRYLDRVHFDRSAERWGVTEAVARTGTGLHPALVVGKLLFWFVMLMIILLAASALGVQNINDIFANLVVEYIPRLFVAIIVIVLGLVLGDFVRALILASGGAVEGVPTLAKVAKGVIITISVLMALQQMSVPVDILTTAFGLILGAFALAVALAFGLGNTKLAGEITRRWYEAGRESASVRQARQGAQGARKEAAPRAEQRELGIEGEAPPSGPEGA